MSHNLEKNNARTVVVFVIVLYLWFRWNLLLVTLQSLIISCARQFSVSVRARVSLLFGVFLLLFLLFFHASNVLWSSYHCVYINYLQHRFYFQSVITSTSNTKKNIRNVSPVWDCVCVVSNFCFPFPWQPHRISWKCSFILLSSTLIDIKRFETIYQGTACFSSRTQKNK